jgi:hypothetical protein
MSYIRIFNRQKFFGKAIFFRRCLLRKLLFLCKNSGFCFAEKMGYGIMTANCFDRKNKSSKDGFCRKKLE